LASSFHADQFFAVRNGTKRINIFPSPYRFEPPSLNRNGLTYRAPLQTRTVASRQVTQVAIGYSAAACTYVQPIAWYPFGTSAQDFSGNDLHGVSRGTSLVADRHGLGTGAHGFDGIDDHIELGDYFNSLDVPFSIAAWVYQPAAARPDFRSIFISDDAPNVYAGLWFQTEPGGLPQITYANGGPVGPGSRRTLTANDPIAADTWVHIAATVRGPTDMTMYVNGQPVPGTLSGSGGPLVHTSAPARIGAFSTLALNRPWLGLLDDLKIWDCSLDANEVAFLFDQY
jgi:hypothetical protein